MRRIVRSSSEAIERECLEREVEQVATSFMCRPVEERDRNQLTYGQAPGRTQ